MDGRKHTVEASAFTNDEFRRTPKISKRKQNEPCCSNKKQKGKSNGSKKERQFAKVSIDILNDDCLREVFSYLSIIELFRLERVSKRWKQVIEMRYAQCKRINMNMDFGNKYRSIMHLDYILKRMGEHAIHLELPSIAYPMPFKEVFETMNRYCKNLKHLKVDIFINAPNDLNGISKKIVQNLTSLHISNEGDICDSALSLILKKAINLEEFKVTSLDLKGSCLSKMPKTLKTLSLSNCELVKSVLVAKALEELPNLQNLDISNCRYMKPSALLPVCKQLVSLNMENVTDFFCISFRPYNGGTFGDLTFPNLRTLNMSKVSLADTFLGEIIENCPLLEKLSLRFSCDINDNDFRKLDNLKHLVRLDVTGTQINDDALLHLTFNYNRFEEIRCSKCRNITQNGLIRFIDRSPNLEYLEICLSKKLKNGFFESALKSVEERSNQKLLMIEISVFHIWDVSEAKRIWNYEAERLNLIKRKGQSSPLKIRPTFFKNESGDQLGFWYVNNTKS